MATTPDSARAPLHTLRQYGLRFAVAALCGGAGGACTTRDLGDCDTAAAEELVFSATGMVATKGQALAHDSCGNGAFCHSASAEGEARFGAPADMNFDMLPSPTGLDELLNEAEAAWAVVSAGEMPPGEDASKVTGNGQWTVDVTGLAQDAPALPALSTHDGKAAFRNWLACGAPTVTDTVAPEWAHAPNTGIDGGTGFQAIYNGILEPRCATAGCHTSQGRAGGLAFSDACSAHEALLGSGTCGIAYLVRGDADASFLIEKLEATEPRCGGPMPPSGALPDALRDALRDWIDAGAPGVDACP